MNQMQTFIEQAKKDKNLMAKLDALGASGAGPKEAVALAAEYGFTVTEEDCREAAEAQCPHKKGELAEEDLEAAAGGATTNRYDPKVCSQYNDVHFNCVGFMELNWCDHYRRSVDDSSEWERRLYRKCMMGFFDVTETKAKDPGAT